MVIQIIQGIVSVVDPYDFRRFSIVVEAPDGDWRKIADGVAPLIRFERADVAWVDIAGLKAFPQFGPSDHSAAFDLMVAAAAPHGWLSDDGKAIRSHVVWRPA